MSTSATRGQRSSLLRAALVHLGMAALCVLITLVYGLFGHGARSWSMDLMCLYPLLAGSGVCLLLAALSRPQRGRWLARPAFNLYNSAIATATVAALLAGIIEIYGTTSHWPARFYLAAAALLVLAILWQLLARR